MDDRDVAAERINEEKKAPNKNVQQAVDTFSDDETAITLLLT